MRLLLKWLIAGLLLLLLFLLLDGCCCVSVAATAFWPLRRDWLAAGDAPAAAE
jgi:hypothetical protein